MEEKKNKKASFNLMSEQNNSLKIIKSNQIFCDLSETTKHTKNQRKKKEMRCYLGTGEWTRHVLTIY